MRSTKFVERSTLARYYLYVELKFVANQIKIASVCLPAMQAMGICGRDSSDTPYFRTFKIQLFNPILDGVLDTPIMDGGQKTPQV